MALSAGTDLHEVLCATSVAQDLRISDCAAVTSVDGLCLLRAVGWGVLNNENPALSNLFGLQGLESADRFCVSETGSLTGLEGLSGVRTVVGLW